MINKVKIKRTTGADTRSSKKCVSRKELKENSIQHIKAVDDVMHEIACSVSDRGEYHDHTKIKYIGLFHDNFKKAFNKEIEFKEHKWWKKHLTERHHLNDSIPEDVNLIDVIEMIVDCVCAGKARTGNVFPIKIKSLVLQQAVKNTVSELKNAIEVVD